MQSPPHLQNAPIAEAVVEFRVRLPRAATADTFAAFGDRLKGNFPKTQRIQYVAADLRFESEGVVKNDVSNTLIGIRLDDPAGHWVVQGKSDGLAVSRLPPYESWDDLVDMVQKVWPVYTEVFQPDAVLRLGVRFINRIPLPIGEAVDLDSILKGAPQIPPALPQVLSEFVTRIVLPVPSEGIVITIVQALSPAPPEIGGTGGHIVLDIDVGCAQTFDLYSAEMWEKLNMMRTTKNRAFFGSLQDDTWKKFQ